jgi:hypothetical protein
MAADTDVTETINMDEANFIDETCGPVHSSFIALAHKLVRLFIHLFIVILLSGALNGRCRWCNWTQ